MRPRKDCKETLVFRKSLFIILLLLLNQFSLDTKTGLWTKSKIVEKNKDSFNEIFKSQEIFEKEFNPNLKIKINSSYTQNSFINNLTNNIGYINFQRNFKEISKFKFKKIKNFEHINPDLLLGKDGSIVFFDDKIFHPSLFTLSPVIGVCLIISQSANIFLCSRYRLTKAKSFDLSILSLF